MCGHIASLLLLVCFAGHLKLAGSGRVRLLLKMQVGFFFFPLKNVVTLSKLHLYLVEIRSRPDVVLLTMCSAHLHSYVISPYQDRISRYRLHVNARLK